MGIEFKDRYTKKIVLRNLIEHSWSYKIKILNIKQVNNCIMTQNHVNLMDYCFSKEYLYLKLNLDRILISMDMMFRDYKIMC